MPLSVLLHYMSEFCFPRLGRRCGPCECGVRRGRGRASPWRTESPAVLLGTALPASADRPRPSVAPPSLCEGLPSAVLSHWPLVLSRHSHTCDNRGGSKDPRPCRPRSPGKPGGQPAMDHVLHNVTAGAKSAPSSIHSHNDAAQPVGPRAPLQCDGHQTAAQATGPSFPVRQCCCLGGRSPGETDCPRVTTPQLLLQRLRGFNTKFAALGGSSSRRQAREAAPSWGLGPSGSLRTHARAWSLGWDSWRAWLSRDSPPCT